MVTATVQFCGAGGTSEAARQVGIVVDAAINHNTCAIRTHQTNHPTALHICQPMEECNPDELPNSDMLLTSPCCTNHSVAKGQKRYHQLDLFGEIIYDPQSEKSRNTMDDVIRFAKSKHNMHTPYKFIIVENVVDVIKWRCYQQWLTSMTTLDIPELQAPGAEPIYRYQVLYWNTQFFGIPHSRDRVYILFWLSSLPAPDLTFTPHGFCAQCQREIAACQSWKRTKWGCYQRQYDYRCPHCARIVAPESLSIRAFLNMNDPGRTLGERKLSEKTRRKIAEGIRRMQGQPFLLGYYKNALYRRLDEPIGTVTTLDRWALVAPAASGSLNDCRMRMLSVPELKRCMGFPETYHVHGNAKEQVWMLGNAVCPPIMANILKRCLPVLTRAQKAA